ncbi:MAG: hypothetical protein WCP82_08780 [Alphaproteobacteria bacterium]
MAPIAWISLSVMAVLPSDLEGRVPSFGGWINDTGDHQFLRGVVVSITRSLCFGVCR